MNGPQSLRNAWNSCFSGTRKNNYLESRLKNKTFTEKETIKNSLNQLNFLRQECDKRPEQHYPGNDDDE